MKNARHKFPIEKRQAVFSDWLQRKPIKDIAEKHGVSLHTIKQWVKIYKWTTQRDEYEKQLEEDFQFKTIRILMDNRIKVISKHFKLADQVESHLEQALTRTNDKGELVTFSPAQINDLAKAAKNTADFEGKAAGLNDKVDPLFAPKQQGGMLASSMIINVAGPPKVLKKATGVIEEQKGDPPPFA
jgi:transposase-like protein